MILVNSKQPIVCELDCTWKGAAAVILVAFSVSAPIFACNDFTSTDGVLDTLPPLGPNTPVTAFSSCAPSTR
jgi:hypothetical protein